MAPSEIVESENAGHSDLEGEEAGDEDEDIAECGMWDELDNHDESALHSMANIHGFSLETEDGVDFCVPMLRDLLSDTPIEGTEKAIATRSAEETLEKGGNKRRKMVIDPNDFLVF